MSYKSIVVQLDTGERAHSRLEHALRLAKQFSAHVSGVFSAFTPDPRSFYVMAGSAEYFDAHREFRRKRHDALERIFQAELLRAGVSGQWIDHNEYASEAMPRYARYADLIIAGQDDPNDPESFIADHFPETLVLSAGRPVLFIPYVGVFPTFGENVMVAWNGSREATRAVTDGIKATSFRQDDRFQCVRIGSLSKGLIDGHDVRPFVE